MSLQNYSYHIYVDGSFLDGRVGYGVVILENDRVVEEISGLVPTEFIQGTRQIAGELYAVQEAVRWCQKNSIQEIDVFYDYKGIEKWATGEWKTKKPLTRGYAEFIRSCGIRIHWHKVDSHTGNRWNERADELARKAAGFTSSRPGMEGNPALELDDTAKEFVQFLKDHGYKAELKGIYDNSRCAKIGVSDADRDIGYVNIYRTKKIPFLPRYHELKDKSCEEKLDSLWQEYHYGERQLPFGS